MRGRVLPVLLLMSLAAACRGDRQADQEQGSAGFVLPGEEAYVSPEDSAQADEAVQAHSDAVRDSLRRAAGGERDARPPAPGPASGNSPEERYRVCLAQANQAEGEVRARLARACENIRGQPPAEAPLP